MLKQNFIEYLEKLKAQLLQSHEPVDLASILNSFKLRPGEHINTYVPHYFAKQLKQMKPLTASLVQKVIILQCALNNWEAIFNGGYADSIVAQYHNTFERLLKTCKADIGWSEDANSVYDKDLAMTQQLLFPAGAQVVENSSGFSIRQGLSSGLMQSVRFLGLNLCQGGNKGYYQIHTHTPDLSEFHPQGWNNCYLRIAQMLELNPQIKGLFGGSWFYDPQLTAISPRLAYLQNLPLEHGASIFRTGNEKSNDAIATSPTRRKLFDEGKYIPQSYLLIWPRKALIKWANTYKTANNIEAIPVKSNK
jgi:hypothetical protein